MENINFDLIQLGTLGVLFFFAIKEFFAFLKSRKEKNGKESGAVDEGILEQLQLMNSNHLQHLNDCMNENNARLIEAIHEDNIKIIEVLGRIDGKLSR